MAGLGLIKNRNRTVKIKLSTKKGHRPGFTSEKSRLALNAIAAFIFWIDSGSAIT